MSACCQCGQFLRKARCAEQHIPDLSVILLPCNRICLCLQIPKYINTHRLLPIFTLAQYQVLSLQVKGCNINFRFCVPISPQLCEVERPHIIGVQFPHPLFADVLINKSNMIRHQAFLDFIHHNTAMSAFYKTHIWIHKGKPEPQIIILDLIKSPLAFLRIILCNGDFPFQYIQINECFQVFRQTGSLDFQNGRDSGQFAVSCGNGLDDGKIAANLRNFLLKQKMWLVIQISGSI